MTRKRPVCTGEKHSLEPKGKGIVGALEELAKLGLGELTTPEIATWISRNMLFHYIATLAQAELGELYRACRTDYVELRAAGKEQVPDERDIFPSLQVTTRGRDWTHSSGLDVKDWKTLREAATYFGAASSLCDQMTTWAKKYCLLNDWFLDGAWLNVCVWCHADENQGSLLFTLPGTYVVTEEGRAASGSALLTTTRHQPEFLLRGITASVPIVPPYNPVATTRSEYLERIDRIIRKYCQFQEDAYKKQGFLPTKRKRRTAESPWDHAGWFVKYQIKKQTADEIANAHPGGRLEGSAVSHAVKEFAGLVGMELRPRKRLPRGTGYFR